MAGSFAMLSLIGYESVHAVDTAKLPDRVLPTAKPVPMPASSTTTLAARMKAAPRVAASSLRRRLPSMAGLASWYGSVLNGHRTASGEIFDKDKLTACHRTLPFGTLVRVIALATGKSVVVKINDRGVLSNERVIDLSSGAARELGIMRQGVARVRLEVLKGNDSAVFGGQAMTPAY